MISYYFIFILVNMRLQKVPLGENHDMHDKD